MSAPHWTPARIRTLAALGIALLAGIPGGSSLEAQARDQPVPDFQVKAAFVYNFIKFVTWPPTAFSSQGDPIRLGIVGEDPVGQALKVVEGQEAQGRKVEIRKIESGTDAAACHLIYVSSGSETRLPELLAKIGTGAVLTIGDSRQLTEQGGMIRFFLEGERVRFEICAERAAARGLKLSSKLLRVARIVNCPVK